MTYLPLQINVLLQKVQCDNYYNNKFKFSQSIKLKNSLNQESKRWLNQGSKRCLNQKFKMFLNQRSKKCWVMLVQGTQFMHTACPFCMP